MSSEARWTTLGVDKHAPGEGLGERYRDEIDGMTSSSAAMRTQTKILKKADEIGALGNDTDDLLEGTAPWLERVSNIKDDDGCSDKIKVAMQMWASIRETSLLMTGSYPTREERES